MGRSQICGSLGCWGAGVQEMGWGVSGSCQELSDWLQMEEVMLCDPGSGHRGHSRLTSSAVFQHQRSPSGILLLPANSLSLPLLRASSVFHHVCFNSCDVTHAEKLWAHRHSKTLISGLKGDQSWTGVCCLINNLQLFSFRFPSLSTTNSTYAFPLFLSHVPSPAKLLPCVYLERSTKFIFAIWFSKNAHYKIWMVYYSNENYFFPLPHPL